MPEKTCSICKGHFHLHEHKNGLVISDQFFICETCANNASDEQLREWEESVMQSPTDGMPIALWLIHEQNKDKPMFSRKK